MKKYFLPLLVFIFFLGFLFRLYRFDYPVADWHSFRQSDTHAVSAIFARDGIDLLHPRYFDISNVQSGTDNPKGYRMVEFPIYNAASVVLFTFSSWAGLTLVEAGRLITIFATLGGALAVYLLVKKYANQTAGFFSAFFYLFMPFSIFYGRTILPDPSMTASVLAGILFFDHWIEKGMKYKVSSIKYWKCFAVSVFFTALAFLLKPYALIFTLPLVWIAWQKFGVKIFKQWQLYLFAAICLIPLIFWRKWIMQYPEGIPVSDWLFNGNGIRFRPSFFKWIFYERITKLILGYVGVLFLVVGSWSLVKNKNAGFFLSFAIASLVYLFVIATGNVQHDYYQILIVPTISIFAGLGVAYLLEKFNKNIFLQFQVICLVIVALFLGWLSVKDYFNINDWGMVEAANRANAILPADATVIALSDPSTTFLNLTQRRGWPVFQSDIEKLINMGAQYMVIANPTPNDYSGFGEKYLQVASGSSYLILKLK